MLLCYAFLNFDLIRTVEYLEQTWWLFLGLGRRRINCLLQQRNGDFFVTHGTLLLGFLRRTLKPTQKTLVVDNVPTDGNFPNFLPLPKIVHTYHAIARIELVNCRIVLPKPDLGNQFHVGLHQLFSLLLNQVCPLFTSESLTTRMILLINAISLHLQTSCFWFSSSLRVLHLKLRLVNICLYSLATTTAAATQTTSEFDQNWTARQAETTAEHDCDQHANLLD